MNGTAKARFDATRREAARQVLRVTLRRTVRESIRATRTIAASVGARMLFKPEEMRRRL